MTVPCDTELAIATPDAGGDGECSNPDGTSMLTVALVSIAVAFVLFKALRRSQKTVMIFDFNQRYWSAGGPRPPCCPPGSHPALSTTYADRGEQITVGGVRLYVVGERSDKAIIVYHDIFGWNSGRLREVCDTLAAQGGFLVVMPDCFQGRADKATTVGGSMLLVLSMLWNVRRSSWARLGPELRDVVLPYAASKGARAAGCLGFCWGSWAVAHACGGGPGQGAEKAAPAAATTKTTAEVKAAAALSVRCGVSFHGSPLEVGFFHGEGVGRLFRAAAAPLLFVQAGNDPATCKAGGKVSQALLGTPIGTACRFEEMPEMQHGWMNRGDLAVPAVSRDVELALKKAREFFNKHLG